MRLRRAVLQIPPKSSVPPWLPLYKNPLFLSHSKSTLLQVLIPLHFNSPRISVYKKPGEGVPSSLPKDLQLVTPHSSSQECPTGSSTGLTLPLFSYSYALFCTAPPVKPVSINHFRTLYTKHAGWGATSLDQARISDKLRGLPGLSDAAHIIRQQRLEVDPRCSLLTAHCSLFTTHSANQTNPAARA
jgi:hypothetical protein